jgi:hypothetical protein
LFSGSWLSLGLPCITYASISFGRDNDMVYGVIRCQFLVDGNLWQENQVGSGEEAAAVYERDAKAR